MTEPENTKEYLTCQYCGKSDETVQETTCPYAADVHNDPTVEIVVCDKCYQNRADDI